MKKYSFFAVLISSIFLFLAFSTIAVDSKNLGENNKTDVLVEECPAFEDDAHGSSERCQYEYITNVEPVIPSVDEVRENGYPTNDAGLTYGPDIKENTDSEIEPDLILVCNEDGLNGYVRANDIKEGAASLDEARHWKKRSYTIPMYLEDGETVIGEFRIED